VPCGGLLAPLNLNPKYLENDVPVIEVKLPQLGMGMQDGQILHWCKAVGDKVTKGEILVEVEAAKAIVEVPSPADGELIKILAEEGETVEVRAPIAELNVD